MTDDQHTDNRPGTRTHLTEETTRYASIVGRNIALLRKQRRMTQRELAAAITDAGYPTSIVVLGFMEIGRAGRAAGNQHRNISVDQLMAFANYFECDPAVLIYPACEVCQGAPPRGFTCNGCAKAA